MVCFDFPVLGRAGEGWLGLVQADMIKGKSTLWCKDRNNHAMVVCMHAHACLERPYKVRNKTMCHQFGDTLGIWGECVSGISVFGWWRAGVLCPGAARRVKW